MLSEGAEATAAAADDGAAGGASATGWAGGGDSTMSGPEPGIGDDIVFPRKNKSMFTF